MFENSLSEPTELNVCQNYLPTVLRNRHVGRGLVRVKQLYHFRVGIAYSYFSMP